MKIAIRVDGNKVLGMGNIYRSLTLAHELKAKKQEVSFIMKTDKEALKIVQKHEFPVFLLNKHLINDTLNIQISHIIKTNNLKMIINDVKDTDITYMKTLKKTDITIVNFDDLGKGRNLADYLFDGFLNKEDQTNKKEYFGPEFMILRDEFKTNSNDNRKNRAQVKAIAIIMGATNSGNILEKIFSALSFLPDTIECHFIFSKSLQDAETYQIDYAKKNFTFHYNPPNVSEIFKMCDLAITAGGISMCETCTLGTPTVVIPQVPHEEKNALMFKQAGAVSSFTFNPQISENEIFSRVNQLISNKKRRVALSQKSREYIDGQGLQRITSILEPHFN